jgi:hypothetical protein
MARFVHDYAGIAAGPVSPTPCTSMCEVRPARTAAYALPLSRARCRWTRYFLARNLSKHVR